MGTEAWGPQMMAALNAVRQMQSDSSRLLRDLDQFLDGYKSVYGSFATTDLSYDIKKGMFMADGLMRHYVKADKPTEVIAVNIAFFDDAAKLKEPLFLAAKLNYEAPIGDVPDRLKAWHPWYAYLKWNEIRIYEKVIEVVAPPKAGTLLRAAVIAVPLFSISGEQRAQSVVEQVRSHSFSVLSS